MNDYTGHFGPLGSDRKWQMYSFERAAYLFWNGFANALSEAGYTDEQIGGILASKLTRWMLDGHQSKIESLGTELGKALAKDGKGLLEILK